MHCLRQLIVAVDYRLLEFLVPADVYDDLLVLRVAFDKQPLQVATYDQVTLDDKTLFTVVSALSVYCCHVTC